MDDLSLSDFHTRFRPRVDAFLRGCFFSYFAPPVDLLVARVVFLHVARVVFLQGPTPSLAVTW